jgi:hypothetical protein
MGVGGKRGKTNDLQSRQSNSAPVKLDVKGSVVVIWEGRRTITAVLENT